MRKISIRKLGAAALPAVVLIALALLFPAVQPVHAAGEPATEPVTVGITELPGGNRQLTGASIELRTADGDVLEQWVSEAEVHTIQAPLTIGETYVVHQVTPTVGYEDDYLQRHLDFCLSRDVSFTIEKNEKTGKEDVHWSIYDHTISRVEGRTRTGISPDRVNLQDPRSRTLAIGKEVLGGAADPEEYFEVILEIPDGVPGQVMRVDLSNADTSAEQDGTTVSNPAKLVIPESGSLAVSFWLKDGQSIELDGIPLFTADYYEVRENNETLDEEGYVTRIIANETISQKEGDQMILQGFSLISVLDSPADRPAMTAKGIDLGILPLTVYAGTEVLPDAISAMNQYATEEFFAVEDPVLDPENSGRPVIMETLGLSTARGNAVFTLNDTLTDGTDTTRTASKRGRIPGDISQMLTPANGVYGDAQVLFINRRDGVMIEKQDEDGNALAGSKLQILDATGAVVHEFTSEDEETVLVALAPGEYTLHEQEPPEGYLAAEDIAFTVVDHETVKVDGAEVDSVVMVDKKDPAAAVSPTAPTEEEEGTDPDPADTDSEKKPSSTGDDTPVEALAGVMILAAAVVAAAARKSGKAGR